MSQPFQWGTVEAAQQIRTGRISAREYLRALLERIERVDPALQAWARLAGDRAAAEAARCDEEAARGSWRGPLHGVPIAIKDNLDTAALETNGGTDLLAGNIPSEDSEPVRRLCAAGAIVLGKTAMTAFAAMDPAPTRNPWNGGHTPGGSSSGSAAAVAAQMCSAALGSQTAGSVLRPAAYCGVVGLKPTYDAVSRKGLLPCAWSMDHIGAIARDIHDVELVFTVLAGSDRKCRDGDAAPPVVGIPDRGFEAADPEVMSAFKRALEVLTDAGVRVVPVRLPGGFEALAAAGIIIMYAEMAAFHRDRLRRRAAEFPPRLRVLVEAGLQISAADYVNAQRIRSIESVELSRVLDAVTTLLTPTTSTPAPPGQSNTGDWRFNLPFSASGHPAITLPCGFAKSGLPVGMQAVAAHAREDRLFALGRLFQERSGWHEHRAPLTNSGIH
jgi:aspartyl-tRNA(Asn)/glutamyl-tRNA(Gln) amidotransferase subunit A